MAENENTNITPEHTLTDEEIAAQDQASGGSSAPCAIPRATPEDGRGPALCRGK